MKTIILLCICILFITVVSNAQVKIGDNTNTINSNSILELESTSKGLLAPRVALNDLNSASPLTAPVPAGMLVYSSGGTLADGFHYWNGTKWLRVVHSDHQRSNYVLVKSASDLPAPVSGLITLNTGWLYEINGVITFSSKINLNGADIKGGAGLGGEEDALIYTGTAEMFTGAKGGNVSNLKLSATAAGSKLFNINALGADEDLIIQNCFIEDNDNIGILQGFGGEIFFENIDLDDNMNGITFMNDSVVIISNIFWNVNNHNTFEKFSGTFQSVQKLGGISRALAINSAIAFDVSGITLITATASIKSTLFDGNGTYLTGSFSKQWEVESAGLNTEKDDVASGNLYISTTAATTFAAVNTPTKILGTTTSVNLFRVTSPANNRLIYTGTKTRRFQVICSLSATQTSSNILYSFYVVKNGVILPESKQIRKLVNNTDHESVSISCTVSLGANDYIEIWVENNTNNTSLTVESFNVAIK